MTRDPMYPQPELRPGSWLAGWRNCDQGTCNALGWLAGWQGGWLAGWLRPREAQRGRAWIEQACHVLGWRLPTNRFQTTEAPHRSLYGTREEAPADYLYAGSQTEIHFKPRASPQAGLRPGRLPTSRVTTREAPHKQNYDQGAHPQPDLRPGSWLWLAGWLGELASWLAGWLGGWLAGLLRPRKAQRGPEKRREAQRSGAWIEQACRALGWDARRCPET